jgi:hypothetical protein
VSAEAVDAIGAIATRRDGELKRVEMRYGELARRTEAELKAHLLSLSSDARLATPGGPGASLAVVRELEWENSRQEREIDSLRRALALREMRERTVSGGSSSAGSNSPSSPGGVVLLHAQHHHAHAKHHHGRGSPDGQGLGVTASPPRKPRLMSVDQQCHDAFGRSDSMSSAGGGGGGGGGGGSSLHSVTPATGPTDPAWVPTLRECALYAAIRAVRGAAGSGASAAEDEATDALRRRMMKLGRGVRQTLLEACLAPGSMVPPASLAVFVGLSAVQVPRGALVNGGGGGATGGDEGIGGPGNLFDDSDSSASEDDDDDASIDAASINADTHADGKGGRTATAKPRRTAASWTLAAARDAVHSLIEVNAPTLESIDVDDPRLVTDGLVQTIVARCTALKHLRLQAGSLTASAFGPGALQAMTGMYDGPFPIFSVDFFF